MALKVKTIKENREIDGYLRIDNIIFLRGIPNMAMDPSKMPKFGLQINYSIFEKNKEGNQITRGQHVLAYKLSNIKNPYEYAYKELKRTKIFKNPIDV